jgi:hypothetical protein
MNTQTIKRLLLGVFLAGLLAIPWLMGEISARNEASEAAMNNDEVAARYGMQLQNVAKAAGIAFEHEAPQLDEEVAHIVEEIASTGAAVSVVDYNRDGWKDLYVTNSAIGSNNRLYRNDGDGTFTDVAGELGIARVNTRERGTSQGAVWADYNNDGYEDLFLYRWGQPELYRNDQGDGFTRVTDGSEFPEWVNASTATWFDYNRDGHVDLFMGGYYHERFNLWDLETTQIMPEAFEYANNGGRNYLFENQGDGTFVDVTEETGLEDTKWTYAAGTADLQGDGFPELMLANDYGTDQIFFNVQGERFEPAGDETGIGFTPKSGMNVAFGDVLNEGKFSIYVTNISEPGVLMQGNNLWVQKSQDEEDYSYTNMAGTMGVELAGWSYGAQFGDLNNDGWQDLYVVNGFISGDRNRSYWYDHSKIVGGHKSIIRDAKNWPAVDGRSHSGHQENQLFLNTGNVRFEEAPRRVNDPGPHDGRSVALVDLWNRGVLDVIVANQRGPLQIFKNQVPADRNWIQFDLEGTTSNRSAIGTRITLHWNDNRQVQQVSGGSGFSSQNQRTVHFGIGTAESVTKAVIVWPSGERQTLTNPEINTRHEIIEPTPPA